MGLTHEEILVDSDPLCVIDTKTRKIAVDSGKTTFLQYDHNSERIGFTMDRFIDGHDMFTVDRVAIKYLNRPRTDMYIVDDLTLSEDKKSISFTWLVSGNVTENAGSVIFQINFRCWDDEGNVKYNWSTQPCSTYTILEGLYSMDANPKELYDFWARYEGLVNRVIENTELAQTKINKLTSDNEDFDIELEELHTVASSLKQIADQMTKDVPDLETRVSVAVDGVRYLESKLDALDRALEDDVAYAISKDVTDLTNDFIELAGKRKFVIDWVQGVWSVDGDNNSFSAPSNVRIRTKTELHVPHAIAADVRIGSDYRFCLGFVNADGIRTSETGWLNDSQVIDITEDKVIAMLCRKDGAEISPEEHVNFECDVIYSFNGIKDSLTGAEVIIDKLVRDVEVIQNGTELRSTLMFRDGGYQGENKLDSADSKISFEDFLKVEPNSKLTKPVSSSRILCAIFYYDTNKQFIEETGWNTLTDDLYFVTAGYIKVQFRNGGYTTLTEQEKNDIKSSVLYYNPRAMELEKLKNEVETLKANMPDDSRNDIINSCNIEYGRFEGASYVFIRIPKTTNDGRTIMPKIALTSVDGSLTGVKRSTLNYSKANGCAVVMNAGLFNVTAMVPVGQTILNGVAVVDEPMESDNGYPISATQCYPMCIDANGNLSAPYARSVSTKTMIADGVVQSITGWGKLVEDFQITYDDIKAEIVHQGKYIRQSIGQYQNGDYAICTVDQSRGKVENESGLTYEALAQIFVDHGVKFAYSLDGGGSAETVVGNRQLNPIYEQAAGRAVPTVISFEVVE